ncbi:hypothetical protein HYQ46_002782 [Verticillium longisporum]|nr:hypothetical protein HYQ44_011061 [Verticillium longisporum]KAG7148349.1 hypothetical protein HYQ46_002782 [Verticillium longisporum]
MARSSISPVDCSAADGLTSLLAATSYLDPQTFAQQSAQTDHEQPLPHNVWGENTLESDRERRIARQVNTRWIDGGSKFGERRRPFVPTNTNIDWHLRLSG